MTSRTLPHTLDRSVVIEAEPETVFRFFSDSDRWASWWGAGSTIEPHIGGRVFIRHPGGVEVSGEVTEVQPPRRIAFTYGYASGTASPAETSLVTIRLERESRGATRLHLSHAFAEGAMRDEHVQGWRYQMAVFSVVVADMVNSGASEAVDAWFRAWSEADAGKSQRILAEVAAPMVAFRDAFSNIAGIADLLPHLEAARRFMPGISLKRIGDVRHCQGTALADWIAIAADGAERSRGTNVFIFGPTGKIESVTGLWARHPGSVG
jgi:uncharacterized protein YndB with AHSA1/START domain